MLREGHYGMNAFVAGIVLVITNAIWSYELGVAGAAVILLTANLPDIDMRLPLIKHRGITHTVWFAGIIGVISSTILYTLGGLGAQPEVAAGYGFFVGMIGVVGHFFGDVLTPMGIKPFAPLSKQKYSFNIVKANNKIANALLLGGGGLVLLVAFTFTFGSDLGMKEFISIGWT